jgi:hypothetical protein
MTAIVAAADFGGRFFFTFNFKLSTVDLLPDRNDSPEAALPIHLLSVAALWLICYAHKI